LDIGWTLAVARKVRDATLDNRTARLKLKSRGKPYYRALDHGLHLGYRRGATAGRWVVRAYAGAQSYRVQTIGTADDVADADGVAVLNFSQAQAMARQRRAELSREAAGLSPSTGPYTVADAIDEYLAWMQQHRRSARGARWAAEAFILPKLGRTECAKLFAAIVRKWHADIAATAPRVRSRRDDKVVRFRDVDMRDPETKRRRRSTANGVLTVLKAALNRAWREGSIASDNAWRRVRPFPEAAAARVRYLAAPECKRLINASPAGFRELVQAALLTGCRYAELAALVVNDFNADSGTIAIRRSKAGRPRHVVISPEGVRFFTKQALGKASDALLLPRADGTGWGPSAQARPMKAACKAANIAPPLNFHGLRHTWASLTVMNGAPLLVVAKNLGHTDTRMVERHYGHLAPSFIADEIRRAAPRFGIGSNEKVVGLRQPR
jgi:integrase